MSNLTTDQQTALNEIHAFLLNDSEPVFVLSGFSGTGKSFLVRSLLDELPNFIKFGKLIKPDLADYEVVLTATTNKAAENLAQMSGEEVKTIHSFLGLRPQTNYRTGEVTLINSNNKVFTDYIIFIDEASCIDGSLLTAIFKKTNGSKIIFIGDPAQLLAVKATNAPVFLLSCPGAALTEVIRQAKGNPIIELSTKFRETVTSGKFFSFTPDGFHIQHLDRAAFNQKILDVLNKPNQHYTDNKVLTWTNKCAIAHNTRINLQLTGKSEIQIGDYVSCNSFVTNRNYSIKTDQIVKVTNISSRWSHSTLSTYGLFYTLDYTCTFFMPESMEARKDAYNLARKEKRFNDARTIDEEWIDLRPVHAQTVNKSQGSTYKTVFIDITDISKCNKGSDIARMMYVAVSRAKEHIYLTGDLFNI